MRKIMMAAAAVAVLAVLSSAGDARAADKMASRAAQGAGTDA